MTITTASRTDIGRMRRKNQDAFRVVDSLHLYVVCDGMGGAAGGEIASQLAADEFVDSFAGSAAFGTLWTDGDHVKNALFHAARAAHERVQKRAEDEPRLHGMGTTLVAAAVDGERLVLVNVGDSRAYLVRDGEAVQLTEDHSFLDEQVRSGFLTRLEADRSMLHSVITRAVGIDGKLEADLFGVALADGDCALLTSDGLTRHVKDAEIGAMIGAQDVRTLQDRCDGLVELALQRGGSDNVTCVLLQFQIG